MKSLMILVATTAIVSGLREATPGFAVDFRTFGGSRIYQDLPYHEQSRTFRETGQHQPYRQESYHDYRPSSFVAREEMRILRDASRGSFKDEGRDGFKDELRTFNDDARSFRDNGRLFRDKTRGNFRDEQRPPYKDDRFFSEELRAPRMFRDEQRGPYRDETRNFRDGNYRDEARSYRDGIRAYDGPRYFHEESGPFRNDVRTFRDEKITEFGNERPFGDNIVQSREPRPYREESGPFKKDDELMFTEESRGLADAQNRFNKEQQNRRPLSYGGHSNYLKYGNHALGYASIPSAVLPLEDNSSELSSPMTMQDMTTTASTQSPNFSKNGVQGTSNFGETSISKSHDAVTLAPEVASTSSQITSNAINEQRPNDNLVDVGSTNPTSSSIAISTSGDVTVTPRVLFTSEPNSMSNSAMRINDMENENGIQQARDASINALRAIKQGINVITTPSSYYQSETSPEVPEGLLNYVFKYQIPEDAKVRYTYRNSPQTDTLNQIQAPGPIELRETAKYTFLPDPKISGLATLQQGPTLNYVPSSTSVSKVPYLAANTHGIAFGAGYTSSTSPSVNFAGNVIQLDRETNFRPLEHVERIPILQSNQYPQFRQFSSNEYLTQLGQYGNFGQSQQTSNVPFAQGGLQLQLGGFGGIDLNGLSSNSEAARVSRPVNLSLRDTPGQAGSTFSKISFSEPIWQL